MVENKLKTHPKFVNKEISKRKVRKPQTYILN